MERTSRAPEHWSFAAWSVAPHLRSLVARSASGLKMMGRRNGFGSGGCSANFSNFRNFSSPVGTGWRGAIGLSCLSSLLSRWRSRTLPCSKGYEMPPLPPGFVLAK